jgi:hypothetical protein
LWFTSPRCEPKSSQDVPYIANIDLDDQPEPCLARRASTMHTRCEPSHAANIVDGLSFMVEPRAGAWRPANDQFEQLGLRTAFGVLRPKPQLDRADLRDGQQPKHVAAPVNLLLEDDSAARRHVEIAIKGDALRVKDLGPNTAARVLQEKQCNVLTPRLEALYNPLRSSRR